MHTCNAQWCMYMYFTCIFIWFFSPFADHCVTGRGSHPLRRRQTWNLRGKAAKLCSWLVFPSPWDLLFQFSLFLLSYVFLYTSLFFLFTLPDRFPPLNFFCLPSPSFHTMYCMCSVMGECRRKWGGVEGEMLSDDDTPTGEAAGESADPVISEEDYQKMLRQHRKRRTLKKVKLSSAYMYKHVYTCTCTHA